jgi:hypothetical protein
VIEHHVVSPRQTPPLGQISAIGMLAGHIGKHMGSTAPAQRDPPVRFARLAAARTPRPSVTHAGDLARPIAESSRHGAPRQLSAASHAHPLSMRLGAIRSAGLVRAHAERLSIGTRKTRARRRTLRARAMGRAPCRKGPPAIASARPGRGKFVASSNSSCPASASPHQISGPPVFFKPANSPRIFVCVAALRSSSHGRACS